MTLYLFGFLHAAHAVRDTDIFAIALASTTIVHGGIAYDNLAVGRNTSFQLGLIILSWGHQLRL